MSEPNIEELIERSSLGTPDAKAARESVPHSTGVAIALAARYLGERDRARDLACAYEAQLAKVHAVLSDRVAAALPWGRILGESYKEAGGYAHVNPDALLALIDEAMAVREALEVPNE